MQLNREDYRKKLQAVLKEDDGIEQVMSSVPDTLPKTKEASELHKAYKEYLNLVKATNEYPAYAFDNEKQWIPHLKYLKTLHTYNGQS